MSDNGPPLKVSFCSHVSYAVPGSDFRNRRLSEELKRRSFSGAEICSGQSNCDLCIVLCEKMPLCVLNDIVVMSKRERFKLLLVAGTKSSVDRDLIITIKECGMTICHFGDMEEFVGVVRDAVKTVLDGRCDPTGLLFEPQAA